ncbi:ABC transporter permease [Konateibacter massiliensis]|uniref:ABC transporter permease n=1 Tax=Konateibacter massiliensis TaxID=2002841 RepID=UPI001F3BFBE2|nr:ABC transporter permease subunit [Konateibacter massiliensis]
MSKKNTAVTMPLPKSKTSLVHNIKKYWPYYIMVLPGVVFFILFKYVPMLGSVIAFQDYSVFKGILSSEWVGLKHFKTLFTYSDFQRIFTNTLLLGLLKTVLIFPIPVVLTLMLNEVKNIKVKKVIQTSIYIPYFLSWVIVGGLIFDLFGVGGLFNNARNALGMDTVLAMQKETWFRPIYVISSIWKEAGWGTVVYLAAISGIDPSLYESAAIDGASRWSRIKYITFPLLIPTILTLFLLNIGSFLELGFDQVFNLITPMTYSVGDIFDTYVYRVGIQKAQYSFTTAVGLFQSVIGLILVMTFNKLANKFSDDGGLW